MVTGLISAMLMIHLGLMLAGGWPKVFWCYENFGLSLDGLLQAKVWQLATYAMLHGDWAHLGINLLLFYFAGSRVMEILGRRKCAELIVLGVIAGGLLHLLTELLLLMGQHGSSHLVGISGACFALLLALCTLSPHSRMKFFPVSGKNLGLGLIIGEALLWLMHPGLGLPGFAVLGTQLTSWVGAGLFDISHACHLGGALAGWWIARRVLAPVAV